MARSPCESCAHAATWALRRSFLAEQPAFIRACEQAGLVFIGPSAEVVEQLKDKIATLNRVQAAGFATPHHSLISFDEGDLEALRAEAGRVGYPLVIKSCSGGRGRGTRVVRTPDQLDEVVRHAHAGAAAVFGDRRVYLERAIFPSRYVEVQLLGDQHGNLVHLGERDSSIQRNNQKIVTESPAPYLSLAQREQLWQAAVPIARLFGCRSACTVEFVVDRDGGLFFTEIKPRIQVEHPVSEWNNFLPSPGRVDLFRAPGGPHVRVDTYAYSGCEIPLRFDPLFAKLIVWGQDRGECLNRLRRALEECLVTGIQTNLPLLHSICGDPDFVRGAYTTEFSRRPIAGPQPPERELRDLAVAAAVAHALRSSTAQPSMNERVLSGWHQSSRRLPN